MNGCRSSIQGSALLFSHKDGYHDGHLHLYALKKRNTKPTDCLNSYIQNTNLHSLPPNFYGVLIVYSSSIKKHDEGKD